LQAALRVDPSAATWNNLGTARFFQGRYTDSVAAFENATKMDSTNYQYWGNLGDAYRWSAGRREKSFEAYKEAIRLLRERIARNPDDVEGRGRLALYLAKSGQQSGALEELERLSAAKNASADASFKKAVVYEILGRREPALAALGEAMRGGYSLHEIENDPELATLRSDVRYHLLVSSLPKK
jgi:eukaryotic-like serine/threonine-protein kinase